MNKLPEIGARVPAHLCLWRLCRLLNSFTLQSFSFRGFIPISRHFDPSTPILIHQPRTSLPRCNYVIWDSCTHITRLLKPVETEKRKTLSQPTSLQLQPSFQSVSRVTTHVPRPRGHDSRATPAPIQPQSSPSQPQPRQELGKAERASVTEE
jgi:hypothetical protein